MLCHSTMATWTDSDSLNRQASMSRMERNVNGDPVGNLIHMCYIHNPPPPSVRSSVTQSFNSASQTFLASVLKHLLNTLLWSNEILSKGNKSHSVRLSYSKHQRNGILILISLPVGEHEFWQEGGVLLYNFHWRGDLKFWPVVRET